jgi:hypothetical protein
MGTALLAGLALPVARAQLERAMIAHMLVQIPLLAIAGALIATDVPAAWKARISVWNRGGIAGTLLAILVSSWWMVPRALDSALASPEAELLKFVSLPLLVGAPAALSWRALGRLGRGFAIANVLPMWAVVRLITVPRPAASAITTVDQQVTAGTGLLWLSVVAGGIACGSVQVIHSHVSSM